MPRLTFQIRSIFDGWAPSFAFGQEDQFLSSIGIDPDMPATDSGDDLRTGGYIRPVANAPIDDTSIDAAPVAIITTPKDNLKWVVLGNGKVSVLSGSVQTTIGQFAGANCRHAFYLNNYIYGIGTGTDKDDVSRIGPLNTLPYDAQSANFTIGARVTGTTSGATGIIRDDIDGGTSGTLVLEAISGLFLDNEAITDDNGGAATVNRVLSALITDGVWTGSTLGSQDPLIDGEFPRTLFDMGYLNHYGETHVDDKGYFTDFIDGVGYLHFIKTMKGTFEGDTNDGSTYGALDMPLNFVPTVHAPYGTDRVVAASPTRDGQINQGNAKLFFWNTTDDSFYRAVPLPDPLCTALKYINGELRGISGNLVGGMRLWRYVGGDSVEILATIEQGQPPVQSAVDTIANRMIWAMTTSDPVTASCIMAHGSKSDLFPRGIHNISRNNTF